MSEERENLQVFEEMFRRNYPRLCQRVQRITNNLETAEDIVQDVFVKLWESGEFNNLSNPEAYFYKSVLHRALNHVSSLKRKSVLITEYNQQFQTDGNNAAQDLELAELQQKVDETIASLPPVCRKVFLLSRYEEMSHKEIADFLGISINTVDNHIKKALSILRKVLLSTLLPLATIYFTFFI